MNDINEFKKWMSENDYDGELIEEPAKELINKLFGADGFGILMPDEQKIEVARCISHLLTKTGITAVSYYHQWLQEKPRGQIFELFPKE